MAMTIGDANDVMAVLGWLVDPERDPAAARDCAIRLADRAYTVLSAGYSAEHIRTGWPVPGLPIACVPVPPTESHTV